MLDFLQEFYFSLYISTWTSFKWLLFSVLIAIGCCLATFLFEFKGKTAQLIWLKFSMSLTAIFALFCLFCLFCFNKGIKMLAANKQRHVFNH